MSTYINCYKALKNLRMILNEYSAARLNGTDTSGRFLNEYLVDKINESQRYIYGLIIKENPHLFLESVSLTGVDSVFTLPADFGILLSFRNNYNDRIYPITIEETHRTTDSGSGKLYYKKGNTFVVDKDGITDTYTLWYYKRCVDMHQGKASAGAATSITFSTDAKKIVDYYNGVLLENETQDWVDTISDYATTRVATITETAAADDYYGTISELPEMFHQLIVPYATMLINVEHPVNTKDVIRAQKDIFNEMMQTAISAYTDTSKDQDFEELFTDYL